MQPLLFFGTPEFAVPTLRALAATELRPALVVSQPSRPAGRGRRLTEPPVVVAARELGIPFEQVERVKDPAFLERVGAISPEIAVVVAFGQIFPRALLELPRRGCVNLHASLLPRWRGAAPIQAAIRAGDAETGVTTMVMEMGLDSGPVLLERATPVGDVETAPELAARLASLGADLMVETLRALDRDGLVPRPQVASGVTVAPKVTKENARTGWGLPAIEIDRAVRAFQPWPGVDLPFAGETVKLISARALGEQESPSFEAFRSSRQGPSAQDEGAVAGIVVAIERDAVVVAAGGGTALRVSSAQRAGRGPVSGGELARSMGLAVGDRLA